jgi:hypothetical protein
MVFGGNQMTSSKVFKGLCAGVVIALALAGCSREYGYSRSAFNTKFLDKTLDQVLADVGQADAVEKPTPQTTILVYAKRTFDQENGNSKDAAVRVTFKSDASGKQVYTSTEFQAE